MRRARLWASTFSSGSTAFWPRPAKSENLKLWGCPGQPFAQATPIAPVECPFMNSGWQRQTAWKSATRRSDVFRGRLTVPFRDCAWLTLALYRRRAFRKKLRVSTGHPEVETDGHGGATMILLGENGSGVCGDATMPRDNLVGSSRR